jgi:hypothetical protein
LGLVIRRLARGRGLPDAADGEEDLQSQGRYALRVGREALSGQGRPLIGVGAKRGEEEGAERKERKEKDW